MDNFLIGLFLATLIISIFTARLYRLIFWYFVNSLMLGLLAVFIGIKVHDNALIVSGVITLVLKALIIPYVLKYLSNKFHLQRQITPNIKVHYSVILIPAILVFTFFIAEPISHMLQANPNDISISISSLFLTLILMMEHNHVAPKIIGFLTLDNALFLLGITATNGMPMLVELGVFFDILMAIVIINLLFKDTGVKA